MIGFLHPEFLLLAVPLVGLLWRYRGDHRVTLALRGLAGAALVGALAGPYLRLGTSGRDVVIVVDRSASMPMGSDEAALELISHAEAAAGPNDRVHVLAFGARSHVERAGESRARFDGFEREIDPDGSDLAAALDSAMELLGRARGSILVVSDGESHGRDPLDVARRAATNGVRIDVRERMRPNISDVAVERVALPAEVAAGEPFQFDVWVRSDRRVERMVTLLRDGAPLVTGRRVIQPGVSRLAFRDLVGAAGVAEYEVALSVVPEASAESEASLAPPDNDRVPENDRARAALLVTGRRALLVVNENGAEDTLTAVLQSGGLAVHVHAPEGAPLDAVALTRYRAVILENVAASRVGRRAMLALREYVEDHGGALLMTGGRAAFGAGGYHKSPLDELLPVSTELRQEHRKMSIALAITMDRSGSMAAPVQGGTKMDLANAGAAAAIELLTPNDAVAVIAVDSAAHVIQPLVQVADPGQLIGKVRSIQSMGGGIFTYTALLAAARELEQAEQLNRHVVLFADAADAEEHEGCFELIATLRKRETTLSVIALGTQADSDATFLEECAARGAGEIYFSTDPADLPRLFAMDTLTMSRSTFVEEPTKTRSLAGLFGLGALDASSFPDLAGYNLCYLRPEATAGVVTTDDYHAPVVAFWQRGLGRAAALTAQVGGTHGRSLTEWDQFPAFSVTLARWLTGTEPPGEFFASTRREGREVVVSVEVERGATVAPDTSRLIARFAARDGERRELPLTRVDDGLFEARLPLDRDETLVGTVDLGGGRSLALAPQTLAYSPEYERGPDPTRGPRALRRIAQVTGGALDPSAQDLFRGVRGARLWRIVTRELALAALILLLLEIAGRRLSIWGSLRLPQGLARRVDAVVARLRAPLDRRRARRVPARAADANTHEPSRATTADASADPASDAASAASAEPAASDAPRAPEPRPDAAADLGSALARARRASARKLDR